MKALPVAWDIDLAGEYSSELVALEGLAQAHDYHLGNGVPDGFRFIYGAAWREAIRAFRIRVLLRGDAE